jgi:hypothetical protein
MSDQKLSKKQIKALQYQINADAQLPPKPSGKPVKLNMSFEAAVRHLGNTPNIKK